MPEKGLRILRQGCQFWPVLYLRYALNASKLDGAEAQVTGRCCCRLLCETALRAQSFPRRRESTFPDRVLPRSWTMDSRLRGNDCVPGFK